MRVILNSKRRLLERTEEFPEVWNLIATLDEQEAEMVEDLIIEQEDQSKILCSELCLEDEWRPVDPKYYGYFVEILTKG